MSNSHTLIIAQSKGKVNAIGLFSPLFYLLGCLQFRLTNALPCGKISKKEKRR